ncbi:MAG: dihydroorotate dehydrogenase electron transfer subunit [Desulfoprunum sp.]|jgi:dihydroorotate dehydrogenase electron transfer subunit|uniref:dihydroorotate dehydrogenase electron transfer subunit n=1 Tax=Desulfoprunum sp. TaxID=2020866 RepID=UPI000B2F61A0
MMTQYQEKAAVIRIERLSGDNVRLTFDCPDIAAAASPGQFVMIRVGTGNDPLLRRPFSIHQTDEDGHLQVYFKVVGRGTGMLAAVREGAEVSILGPLGRGFQVADSPACLVGGGLGMAPLLFLARKLSQLKRDRSRDTIILGGRTSSEVEPLVKDFEEFGMTVVATTDDGSYGQRGFVTAAFSSLSLPSPCTVYCCGPEPMLAGMSVLCRTRGYSCQVSVESVMACGMGACLGCSKPNRDGGYVHVCVDGPVFDAEEMAWNI